MDEKIIEEWLKVSSGSGYGYGDGSGDGSGSGIKYYNSHKVFVVDSVNTIITGIKGNVARGYILKRDLTTEKTFVVKGHNKFAHGKTIKEAMIDLQNKIFEDLDAEERIEEFKNKFNKTDKYLGHDFYNWHHILTGSCLQGRNNFVEENNIDLKSKYTVKEFLRIVKGAYGWEYLKNLEDYYN